MDCNFCKTKLNNGEPYWGKNNRIMCGKCSLESTEFFVELDLGGIHLFWIEFIKQKYFSRLRKKRMCYLSQKIRKEILKKYKFTCQNCGTKEKLTIDHIKPVSKGGTDDPDNLTILCKSCNSKKSNKYAR